MSKPTPEQIVTALRCQGRVVNCQNKCAYNIVFNLDGDTLCALGALHTDAADLIEQQAARIRELEASERVVHSHWLVEPVVIGVVDGEKLTCFNPKCRRSYGTVTHGERPDYCPHCGARMDGGAA